MYMSSLSQTNTGTIGIKIANGSYYPILQEGGSARKRLVLTTVKDEQESVQIDLYKGRGDEIEDAVYIGSLVIENIEAAPGGEPEIELVLGLDDEGNLTATAGDNSSGETQSLSVSMESLDEQGIYDIPEFDLDESFSPEPVLTREEETRLNDEYRDDGDDEPAMRRRSPLLLVAFILFGIAIVVLLAFLLMRLFRGEEVPPLQAQGDSSSVVAEAPAPAPEPEPEPEPASIAAEEPAQPEPAETPEPAAAPEPEPEPAAAVEQQPPANPVPAVGDGVWYQLQWGDTLWDLSASFYRDPFRYGQIAAENGIQNPDRIFAGRDIYIPEPRR